MYEYTASISIWQAIVLGIVQGLTEFLPISSSGHLVLFGRIVGVSYMPLSFELITHVATLLAVMLAMRKSVAVLAKKPFQKTTLLIILATIPTVIIFFVFRNVFESALDGRWLAFCFLITAIVLLASNMIKIKNNNLNNSSIVNRQPSISLLDAIIIGILQGIAGLPGISRSGITISGAKMLGVEQKAAAEFSFLIAIPIIIGATLFHFISHGFSLDMPVAPLVAASIAAFITGFIAVSFMLKLLKKFSLDGFAIYLVLLSAFILLNDFALFWF